MFTDSSHKRMVAKELCECVFGVDSSRNRRKKNVKLSVVVFSLSLFFSK